MTAGDPRAEREPLTWTTAALSERVGVDLGPALDLSVEEEPLPWHVRLVVGTAGWVASSLFLTFVGLLGVFDESDLVVLGPLTLAVAVALRRVRLDAAAEADSPEPASTAAERAVHLERLDAAAEADSPEPASTAAERAASRARLPWGDFFGQVSLVLALTGRLFLAVGLAEVVGEPSVVAAWLAGLEVLVGLALPDPYQRFFSTFAACGWLVSLAGDATDAWVEIFAVAATAAGLATWAFRGPLEIAGAAFDRRFGLGRRGWVDGRLAVGLATPVAYGLTAFSLALPLRFLWDTRAPLAAAVSAGFGLVAFLVVARLLGEHRVAGKHAAVALLGTVVVGALSWRVPGLLLALSFALVGIRAREIKLLGLAAAFLVFYGGYTYYRLDTTLAIKGLSLLGSGVVLLAARGLLRLRAPQEDRGRRTLAHGWAILALVLPIVVVGVSVVERERLLANGEQAYLELAPVDPRSLLQGDYMRLAFRVARQGETALGGASGHGTFVLASDERGVRTFVRVYTGESLAPGESLLAYRRRARGIEVATRAWLFQEGLAEEYGRARYGEFRVDARGRAILVGLADEELHPLGPPRRRW